MTNDAKYRHVLAAAVRAGAHAILTENVKHFPARSFAPHGIGLLPPDRFLKHQFQLERELFENDFASRLPRDGFHSKIWCGS